MHETVKKYLPVGLATLVILSVVAFTASADEISNAFKNGKGLGRNAGPRVEVKAALESGDYDAWVKAETQNGRQPEILKTITKDTFAQFVEMHKLMKAGKLDEAQAIAAKLGLPAMGHGRGGMGQGMWDNEVANTALQNKDYDAWVKAVSQNGTLPKCFKSVTKENFAKFAEAKGYEKQGMELIQKSRELMKEIGIEKGPGFGRGEGRRGMGRGMMRFGTDADDASDSSK